MKICLLSKMFPPGVGGSERYAHELANALGPRGHTVHVFTQTIPGRQAPVPLHDNVTVHRITKARRPLVTFETLYYSLKARYRVDFDAYDVIHGTLMPASTIALTPRLGITTPIVLTSHGTSVDETLSHVPEVPTDYLKRYFFHPTNVVLDTIAGRSADRIVAISQATRHRLINTYRFSPDRVVLIPHGVDLNRFHPHSALHPAVSPDKHTLLFVGRLVARKGADLAIDAVATLDRTDVELLIAGTGRHADRLRARARDRGIADRVQFLGYIPESDLPQLYSAADALVFPSRYEGFGLVFLEAMACGTPVIGTPVGGVPDVITDENNGIIAPPNAEHIARRIARLLDNPDHLAALGQAAHHRASDMSWDVVAAQIESVYANLVPTPHQSTASDE